MSKVLTFIRNYFVEVVGFLVIMALVVLISFLKFYRKTYNCSLTRTADGMNINESYVIKQKNNHIKEIDYKYVAKPLSNKFSKNDFLNYYKKMVEEINKSEIDLDVDLSYKNGKIYLSYTLTDEIFKDIKEYKSTRVFLRNIKSIGFTCK